MSDEFSVEPGVVLGGRYAVEQAIADGGQSRVWLGRHLALDRPVAIKCVRVPPGGLEGSKALRRFEREARTLSRLRDPHTITLYDYGVLPGGAVYIVSEYIEGFSLKEAVRLRGPMHGARAARVLGQVLSSLHEAHTFGVMHRDIKPANIMVYDHVGRRDLVKVLDFGIAKVLRGEGGGDSELTDLHALVGTPRYMAPELYQDGIVARPESDLYSLGLVIYELITGVPAIRGETPVAIWRFHMARHSVRLPREAQVPAELRAIVDKMLRYEPSERYKSARAVERELGAFERAWASWLERGAPRGSDELELPEFAPAPGTSIANASPDPRLFSSTTEMDAVSPGLEEPTESTREVDLDRVLAEDASAQRDDTP